MRQQEPIHHSTLRWERQQQRATLSDIHGPLLDLHDEKPRGASFMVKGDRYSIRHLGLWNPRTVVKRNDQEVVRATGSFWGSAEHFTFPSGSVYQSRYRNNALAELVYARAQGPEVISYRLVALPRPHTVVVVHTVDVPEEDLLLLLALGHHAFRSIAQEAEDGSLALLLHAG